VLIGLGSMLGAGVFAAFAPAAAAAGSLLLVGLLVAAVVAYCNATSSAQLAAQFPSSGGTYLDGRRMLGPGWGFLAGWGFVVGKTASCAAMALTVAAYAVPGPWQRPLAVAVVLALTAVNYRGITRTARLTRVLVVVVLVALAAVVLAGVGGAQPVRLGEGPSHGWYGVLQSGGLLFFAFAGYARIATLGEEVRDPARTIPRAVQLALGLTVLVYAAVAGTALLVLGPTALADSPAPLVDVVRTAGWPALVPLVRVGAVAAALGALLALIAGVGRTGLAMAREGDLPRWLAAVHPHYQVPHRAQVAVGLVVCLLVLVTDLRGVIGFSSVGVLVYYLVANLSARAQRGRHRRFPRVLQDVGAAGCVLLVVTLPWTSVLAGALVLATGPVLRALGRRRTTR
jgi:APA family basic amino acid/polyamine antiporter